MPSDSVAKEGAANPMSSEGDWFGFANMVTGLACLNGYQLIKAISSPEAAKPNLSPLPADPEHR